MSSQSSSGFSVVSSISVPDHVRSVSRPELTFMDTGPQQIYEQQRSIRSRPTEISGGKIGTGERAKGGEVSGGRAAEEKEYKIKTAIPPEFEFQKRMKRKDFEDDFPSHRFSRKSRRLDGDGELLLAMEEDPGAEVPPLPEHQLVPVTSIIQLLDATVPSPDERAFKLYSPSNSPFLRSTGSPEFPIIINSQLIPGLKEHLIWPENSEPTSDESSEESNGRLAVIPWTAQSRPPLEASETLSSRQIDSEDADMDMMEMEYSTDASSNNIVYHYGEGFHPWQQQQHRLTPYFPGPQSIPAPLTW